MPGGCPGVTPFDFAGASVSNSNLGGLCTLVCDDYDTSTGVCVSYNAVSGGPACNAAEHRLLFGSLGESRDGRKVDLRVTNTTDYFVWDSNENGRSGTNGSWGQINVLGNHVVEFLFESIDAVRSLAHATAGPRAAGRVPRCPLACQPASPRSIGPRSLALCRSPESRWCSKTSGSRCSTSTRPLATNRS